MKKTIFIFGFILLILISFVSAIGETYNNDLDLLLHYAGNDSGIKIRNFVPATYGKYDLIYNGTENCIGTEIPNGDCALGFTGDGATVGDIAENVSADIRAIINNIDTDNWSICFWINQTGATNSYVISMGEITDVTGYYAYWLGDGTVRSVIMQGFIKELYATGHTTVLNQLYFMCSVVNDTAHAVYIDGDLKNTDLSYNFTNLADNGFHMGLSRYGGGYYYGFTGNLAEIELWNRSLSQAEIDYKYINGKIRAPPIPPPPALINIYSPLNNSVTRNESVNVTFSFSGFNATNCNIYDNLTGNFSVCNSIGMITYNITTNTTEEVAQCNIKPLTFFRFEDNLSNTAVDITGNINGTILNGAIHIPSKGSNATGNLSLYLDGINDYVNIEYNSSIYSFDEDLTISLWVNHNIGADSHIITKDNVFDLWLDKSGGLFFLKGSIISGGTTYTATSTSSVLLNTWTHVLMTFRNSYVYTYINGIQDGQSFQCAFCSIAENLSNTTIGKGTGYFEGAIDEVMILNESLNDSTILEIYNHGIQRILNITTFNTTYYNITINQSTNYTLECALPSDDIGSSEMFVNCYNGEDINSSFVNFQYDTDFTPPNITMFFPTIDNEIFNFNMWINFSTDENSICILNLSGFQTYLDNGTFFSYNETDLNNSFYSLLINCSDFHTFAPVNSAYKQINFTKDIQYPIIIISSPLNDSDFVMGEDNLYIKYTTYDNRDLFSINYNITESFTGDIVYEENLTVSGVSYSENFLVNIDNYTPDIYYFSISVCDSHTDKKIPPAKSIIKTNDTLKYQFGKTNINIKSLSKVNKIDTDKLADRYTFDFEYADKLDIKIFELSSNQQIVYRPDSDYKGHFVLPKSKLWIDFEQKGDVIVSQEEDRYIIEIANSDNKILFNSIGTLNCEYKQTYFHILLEGEPTGINLGAFDLSNINNVILLFLIGFLWVAVITLAFFFKNFGFASLGFFLGLILGFMFSGIHIFLTLLFWLLNVVMFIRYAIKFK